MSRTSHLAVGGLVALWLSLTLSACSERSSDKLATEPKVEPSAQSDTPSTPGDAPIVQSESPPTPLEPGPLREGPYTAEARNRVAELARGDARTASEAQRALARLGRDAVPALVEALEGAPHDLRTKQLATAILGEMGVAARPAYRF